MKRMNLIMAVLFAAAWIPAQAEESAIYEVTVHGTWTMELHPLDFPEESAHFSPPVVASHNDSYSMLMPGSIATPGLEDVAETGKTMVLEEELMAARATGSVADFATGSGISTSTGMASVRVEVNKSHPLISAVTMLAPSPDWVTGVDAVSVVRDGEFVERLVYSTFAVDAGTDSGESYMSPDQDTKPRQNVGLARTPHFTSHGELVPVGKVEIKRID